MSGLEIFLLITGLIFIIISFFLIEKKENKTKKNVSLNVEDIVSQEEMEKVIQTLKNRFEGLTSDYIIDADDKLSSIANEKIIAVNDFSEQLLGKLENNHQEVIFLYNMLKEKEEDMKSTLNRMEVVRKENQEFMNKIMELRNAKVKSTKPMETVTSSVTTPMEQKKVVGEDAVSAAPSSEQKVKDVVLEKKSAGNAKKSVAKQVVAPEVAIINSESSRNDKILSLHRQKKSVMEISKLLSLGQGEVKLVIDLYGRL